MAYQVAHDRPFFFKENSRMLNVKCFKVKKKELVKRKSRVIYNNVSEITAKVNMLFQKQTFVLFHFICTGFINNVYYLCNWLLHLTQGKQL